MSANLPTLLPTRMYGFVLQLVLLLIGQRWVCDSCVYHNYPSPGHILGVFSDVRVAPITVVLGCESCDILENSVEMPRAKSRFGRQLFKP